MNKNLLKSIFITLIFTISIFSQTTKPTPPPTDDNDVVKVTTSLVQVDAVVTDKDGNSVTNLTASDFSIFQDGKSQTITNVTYVNRTSNELPNQKGTVQKRDKSIPLPPPSSAVSSQFGRVLTFVVDDGNCNSTISGMTAVRDGLEKFVNEQMLPNDSVAIYQTRNGSSLLQQYTSDKTRLLKIISKIRWFIPMGMCNSSGSSYEPVRDDSTGKANGGTFESERDKATREAINDSEKSRKVESVIGVLRYAINGLKEVNGRKLLFLMSDSIPIIVGNAERQRLSSSSLDALKEVTNLANRASVVINSIDVRGLDVPMMTSQDNPGGIKTNVQSTSISIAARESENDSRQSGLGFAADETGGKFFKNMNRLDTPIQRVLTAESGYYLISYEPEDDTFKGKSFHKIEIKLKRSDLNSSSRSGFYGVTDDEMRPKPRTGDSELYQALVAPVPNSDMNVRLSSYFANNAAKGNFIHAILYIDGKDITFVDGLKGNKKAIFDIVAVTLNEKNEVIDDSNSTQTVQIPLDKVEEIKRDGLIYTVDVPVKKAGFYTFRTALREANTKKLSSSSQIIEVPDLKKNKLLVSGLILSGVDNNGKLIAPETGKSENGFSLVISKSIPSIRQFRRNSIVGYAYTIYNAKIDTTTNQPKLTIQTNLYNDGKILVEGTPQNAQLEAQSDMSRINDYGYLRLNPNLPIGDYVVQIIIKDLSTNQTTSQWIDFEVVE